MSLVTNSADNNCRVSLFAKYSSKSDKICTDACS